MEGLAITPDGTARIGLMQCPLAQDGSNGAIDGALHHCTNDGTNDGSSDSINSMRA